MHVDKADLDRPIGMQISAHSENPAFVVSRNSFVHARAPRLNRAYN